MTSTTETPLLTPGRIVTRLQTGTTVKEPDWFWCKTLVERDTLVILGGGGGEFGWNSVLITFHCVCCHVRALCLLYIIM